MITFINYADGYPFEKFRKLNSWSARLFGKVDSIIEYSNKDIPEEYKERHKAVFAYRRGAGLWLWKSWIINDALSKIKEGDWLFYCDSGAFVIRNLRQLIKCAEKHNTPIFLVEQPLLNRQFTKREAFVQMGIEDNGENQLLSGYILLKKCQQSVDFIKEWQLWSEREDMSSPEHFHPEIKEFEDFYSHREDQSILTLLRLKYNLPAFRDCSDYGEFPHMYFSSEYTYSPLEYRNSDYPTIIMCSRKKNPYIYTLRYILKCVLKYWGLVNPEKIIAKKKQLGL